jgi:8-oxo-dGTP pyrophosphatase MutT (NUDIX family)
MPRHYEVAGVLLIDKNGHIIAQHRDIDRPINFPGKATFFGGKVKPGEELLDAALRELAEETSLRLTEEDVEPYLVFDGIGDRDGCHQTFTVYIAKGVSTEGLQVFEGQGFHIVKSVDDPLIAEVVMTLFQKWFTEFDHFEQAEHQRHTDVHRYAAALFVTKDGRLFGQHRDDIPSIDAPGKVSGFGGAVEDGELPREACLREIAEETNRKVTDEMLEDFCSFTVWRPLTKEYERSVIYLVRDVEVEGLEVYEGQGYKEITSADPAVVAPPIVPAAEKWFKMRAHHD